MPSRKTRTNGLFDKELGFVAPYLAPLREDVPRPAHDLLPEVFTLKCVARAAYRRATRAACSRDLTHRLRLRGLRSEGAGPAFGGRPGPPIQEREDAGDAKPGMIPRTSAAVRVGRPAGTAW